MTSRISRSLRDREEHLPGFVSRFDRLHHTHTHTYTRCEMSILQWWVDKTWLPTFLVISRCSDCNQRSQMRSSASRDFLMPHHSVQDTGTGIPLVNVLLVNPLVAAAVACYQKLNSNNCNRICVTDVPLLSCTAAYFGFCLLLSLPKNQRITLTILCNSFL